MLVTIRRRCRFWHRFWALWLLQGSSSLWFVRSRRGTSGDCHDGWKDLAVRAQPVPEEGSEPFPEDDESRPPHSFPSASALQYNHDHDLDSSATDNTSSEEQPPKEAAWSSSSRSIMPPAPDPIHSETRPLHCFPDPSPPTSHPQDHHNIPPDRPRRLLCQFHVDWPTPSDRWNDAVHQESNPGEPIPPPPPPQQQPPPPPPATSWQSCSTEIMEQPEGRSSELCFRITVEPQLPRPHPAAATTPPPLEEIPPPLDADPDIFSHESVAAATNVASAEFEEDTERGTPEQEEEQSPPRSLPITTMDHSDTTTPPSSSLTMLRVGSHVYSWSDPSLPWAIRQALNQRPRPDDQVLVNHVAPTSSSSLSPDQSAAWYVNLAVAHRSVAEATSTPHSSSTMTNSAENDPPFSPGHLDLAINALQQALRIYQGMQIIQNDFDSEESSPREDDQDAEEDDADETDDERDDGRLTTRSSDDDSERDVDQHIAAIYFQLGEMFSLKLQYALARDYLLQAEATFKRLLQDETFTSELDAQSLRELELSYAHCCMRLGYNLLEGGGGGGVGGGTSSAQEAEWEALLHEQQQQLGALMGGTGGSLMGGAAAASSTDLKAWWETLSTTNDSQNKRLQKIVQDVERAQRYFAQAVDIYRRAVEEEPHVGTRLSLRSHLATGIQNQGTASTLKGDFDQAIRYSEEALTILDDIFPRLRGLDQEDAKKAVAEVLVSLSDSYLQLGRYQESNDRYQRAMDWYSRHGLTSPADGPESELLGMSSLDETLALYENALEEYNQMFGNGYIEGGQMDEEMAYYDESTGEYYYEQNEAYEGDLHLSLASLYMTKGDHILATSHFTQAIRLYHLAGEPDGRSTADAKYNLAMVHFRNGEFAQSEQVRREALEIYRSVVGEGVNPLSEGISDLLQQMSTEQTGPMQKPPNAQDSTSASLLPPSHHSQADGHRGEDDKSMLNDQSSSSTKGSDHESTTKTEKIKAERVGTAETILDLEGYRRVIMNLSAGATDA